MKKVHYKERYYLVRNKKNDNYLPWIVKISGNEKPLMQFDTFKKAVKWFKNLEIKNKYYSITMLCQNEDNRFSFVYKKEKNDLNQKTETFDVKDIEKEKLEKEKKLEKKSTVESYEIKDKKKNNKDYLLIFLTIGFMIITIINIVFLAMKIY